MAFTLFWLVRHGTTTDSNKNIIRGNRNSMLDRQGFLDAHELKDFFAPKQWQTILCSDMTRAIQTATIIAEPRDIQPIVVPALEPWDVGYLTGKDKAKYNPDMTVFIEHPDMVPHGGQSRNDFFRQVYPVLVNAAYLSVREGVAPVVIGHSSVIHALAHMLWGEMHPSLAVDPGGVIEVFLNKKGIIDAREVFKKGRDDSSFQNGHTPTS